MAEAKLNKLNLTEKDYDGAASTMCKGCGHDAISASVQRAYYESSIDPRKVVKLSGIGCSSKTPAYFLSQSFGFNAVHGRMSAVATGANLANHTLLPIGVLQAATFGLAVVAGNWVVPLLERQGTSSAAAGFAGGLVLSIGIVTRPTGGLVAHRVGGRNLVALALIGTCAGAAMLSLDGPFGLAVAGALVLGLAAGLPFAVIFAAAQRARPDAPASAIALVNACGILTVLVGTPLAGLTFELPSDGRLAFAVIAVLSALALLALRAARL